MRTTIVGLTTRDIRFPTSCALDGSDAMNEAPDYSAAYVILETDTPGLTGHGMTFTTGRGNELCVAAIEALAPRAWGAVSKRSRLTWVLSGHRWWMTDSCVGSDPKRVLCIWLRPQ